MENMEAMHPIGVAASPAKRAPWECSASGLVRKLFARARRRPLFQKVIIANTVLIIIGSTVGIYLEDRFFRGGYELVALFVSAAVTLSIAVNCIMVKLAFRPLDDVVGALQSIRNGGHGIRVPEVRDDPQIEELSHSLNAMLSSIEQQRKKGTASAIKAQEEERKRIARELHDETSQSLTGLVIGIKIAEEMVPEELPEVRERLRGIKELAHATLSEVHTMAVRLRPSVLDDLGLSAALRSYVKDFTENTGIFVDLRLRSMAARLPARLETVLYRVVQEALTNVARHANASGCRVILERSEAMVSGSIIDNGRGFDPLMVLQSEDGCHGLGLHGMKERIGLVNGRLNIDSSPEAGSAVHLEVPIDAKGGYGE